ncbi:glycosyltransferase [Hymenobacter sp. BT491]|uniref:glycosyltransferase n=1 Tax=Hymenobacter sp. BT491 TaxID=2766779 RepID=UPI001653E1BF|nr:glycosyltransferase [Hymenobacter sp. BT491]MBC6988303.1 glycosyltransferase [Hymenobacter sp. BT491]
MASPAPRIRMIATDSTAAANAAPHVLFISYDGMTDPLGQSQVLPYLTNLAKRGYRITLLSTEKPERFEQHRATIEAIVQKAGITWEYIFFRRKPPGLAKFFDLRELKQKALSIHRRTPLDMTHCRSYVSAAVGLMLKRKFGIKMLFDMRGFWVDERVDGGIWNLRNPVFRYAYRQYKQKEASYIAAADGIISLTENGKQEIQTWPAYKGAPITVIPCSTDFDLFPLIDRAQRAQGKAELGIPNNDLVISYLGSVGGWYLLDDMLRQFWVIKQQFPTARMLFITQDSKEEILAAARKLEGLREEDFLVRAATRQQVPKLLAASDINLFFIKQSYSKKASSPTKLGEILAMGIPVICNAGVGDVESIIRDTDGGIAIPELTEAWLQKAAAQVPQLLAKDPETLRRNAQPYYDLGRAVASYEQQYARILNRKAAKA